MTYIIFLPLVSLLLVIFQVSVTDAVFFGKINLEISLLLVVYAGFHLRVIKGFILSFLLGFFLDCIAGSIFGLFTFIYTFLFFISLLVYPRVYPGGKLFVMVFTLICVLLEQLLVILFNELISGANLSHQILRISPPQGLVLSIISPVFFKIFYRLEVLLSGGDARSFKGT